MSTKGWLGRNLHKLSSAILLLLGMLAIAFLLWQLASSERRIAAVDGRAVSDLAILVDGLEQWPAAAAAFAASNYPTDANAAPSANIRIPDLGRIEVRYSAPPQGRDCPIDQRINPGPTAADAKLRISNKFNPSGTATDVTPTICFETDLPLDELLRVRQVAPELSHLLIARRDGAIVAQLGGDPLPITNSDELRRKEDLLLRLVGNDSDKRKELLDPAQPFRVSIGGIDRRVYRQPIWLAGVTASGAGQAGAAPSDGTAAPSPASRAAPAAPSSATREFLSAEYVAIAIAPHSSITRESRQVSRALVAGLLLLTGFLLALTPTLKLRLMGPVDDLSSVEAAAIISGQVIALYLAVIGAAFAFMLVDGRSDAAQRVAQTARLIAADASLEIHGLLGPNSATADLLGSSVKPAGESGGDVLVVTRSSAAPFPQPDAILPVDRGGGLADGTRFVTLNSNVKRAPNVGERPYFQRALRGEYVPDAELRLPNCKARYAIGQIRALTDGIPRTAIAANIANNPYCPAIGPVGQPERAPAAIIIPFVLRSLLSPALPSGVDHLVVDPRDPQARVLFHSVPARAQVESVLEWKRQPLVRATLDRLAREPAPCGEHSGTSLRIFNADYDGRPRIFAADRIGCTPWVVLTHVDRGEIDARAARIAGWALTIAGGMGAITIGALLALTAIWRERAWTWLWPRPHLASHYRAAALWIGLVGVLSLLILIVALWLDRDTPFFSFALPALLLPLLAWGVLWFHLGRATWVERWRKRRAVGHPKPRAQPLLPRTERSYAAMVAMLLLSTALVPAIASVGDAIRFVDRSIAQGALAEERRDLDERSRQTKAVAAAGVAEEREAEAATAAGLAEEREVRAAGKTDWRSDWKRSGDQRLPRPQLVHTSFADVMQAFVAPTSSGDEAEASKVRPGLPPTATPGRPLALYLTVVLGLAIVLMLIWKAARTAMAGLFGFAVPLAAVSHRPRTPRHWDWSSARPKCLVIGAKSELQAEIRADRDPAPRVELIDLIDATRSEEPSLPYDRIDWGFHIVVDGLELLLRDPVRRLRALRILELLVRRQRRAPTSKLVVLADLSPLERLLQRFEREDELFDPDMDLAARQQIEELKRHREDVRWSKLFAEFTTYSHDRAPALLPGRAGKVLRRRWKRHGLPTPSAKLIQRVLRELRPLPEAVVRPALAAADDQAIIRVIHAEAQQLPHVSEQQLIDHYSNMFIEHYQLVWSASSHAERLIMYHLAHDRLINLASAYSVRTLIRRGVVVLDPIPRLFNRSFGQFVRNVEKPETLRRWRKDVPSGWRRAQLPVLLFVPAALVALLLMIQTSGQSVAALAPLLVAAAPALLQTLGILRRPGTA